MLFSSIIFMFYFLPVVLVLYYLFRKSYPVKNGILLVASLFFYAWGEPWFVLIMLASLAGNYVLGILADRYRDQKTKARVVLTATVVLNIGLLFLFKYTDFVIRNINEAVGTNIPLLNLGLPIGISFFTFQALSYVIDVYRGNGRVQKNPFYMALYIAFFPQLIAGPIVRYSTIDEQICHRKETWDKFSVGVCRFITGFGKKILLANNFAIVADNIFTTYANGGCPTALAWLGSFAYTFQILYDFSGYSDMAIGLGLMFGFKFEENFNYPYISLSIGEFWRRWHISLGNWFKEYVYFPLGGSRVKNMDKVIRNMLVVWVCTGIWHGAEWTFLIWGLLNFTCLVFERFTGFEDKKIPDGIKWFYTMFIVNLGWTIFRSPDLVSAGKYIASMFGIGTVSLWTNTALMYLKEYGVFFIAAALLSVPIAKRYNRLLVDKKISATAVSVLNLLYPVMMMCVLLIGITYLVKGSYNPFIYFNF
ncbi:MBOAT family O-acyltransferase [Eisenbergiella tayi]|uniref:Peptidoglycan O-acetyltransferase n=1 Tax=Eisenbergiella tayi TaxID=1432052 RepID=A0A1E3AL50_9FIRM|nr:MBOAT family protein [Eisenbergiella tayi]ODM08846.1 Peptidoglycan O-acetyltransferase [Eisenbergiella tayi]